MIGSQDGVGDPEPGRPRSLGREVDLADAEVIARLVEWCRATLADGRGRTGPLRLVREAMWFAWESPRLPRPLVSGKYPVSYPWSPNAQAAYARDGGRRPAGGFGLVIEHLYPRELLMRDLLGAEDLEPDAVVALLATRLTAAVVTKEDDGLLPARGRLNDSWQSYDADPWLRYRESGMALKAFAPVGTSA